MQIHVHSIEWNDDSHLGNQQHLPVLDWIMLDLELVSRILSEEARETTMWRK